jgi:hypothetical protein
VENSPLSGVIHNNIGISHFFKFIALSQHIQNPSDIKPEMIQTIVECQKNAIKNLKMSVRLQE